MSRYLNVLTEEGYLNEVIASMDECYHLINGMCYNDLSDQCREYVDPEYCAVCPHFTKEDGILR